MRWEKRRGAGSGEEDDTGQDRDALRRGLKRKRGRRVNFKFERTVMQKLVYVVATDADSKARHDFNVKGGASRQGACTAVCNSLSFTRSHSLTRTRPHVQAIL